jgi:hypothetical protein
MERNPRNELVGRHIQRSKRQQQLQRRRSRRHYPDHGCMRYISSEQTTGSHDDIHALYEVAIVKLALNRTILEYTTIYYIHSTWVGSINRSHARSLTQCRWYYVLAKIMEYSSTRWHPGALFPNLQVES